MMVRSIPVYSDKLEAEKPMYEIFDTYNVPPIPISGSQQFVNCLKQGKICEDLGNDLLLASPVKIDSPELGRSIILIDTPGRDPWNLSWGNILTMLKDWLTDQ